jgi:hypothetical protein
MTITIPFNVIETIRDVISDTNISLTNAINNMYPAYSQYIYDITTAYFRYNHISIINNSIPIDILNDIEDYMYNNNILDSSLINYHKLHAIKQYFIRRGFTKYSEYMSDIIFVIFHNYNMIPVYEENISFKKIKV